MIDGTYDVRLEAIPGVEHGKLVLAADGPKVTGSIDAPVTGTAEVSGSKDGARFHLSGNMMTAGGGITRFECFGVFGGGVVTGSLRSEHWERHLVGRRRLPDLQSMGGRGPNPIQ